MTTPYRAALTVPSPPLPRRWRLGPRLRAAWRAARLRLACFVEHRWARDEVSQWLHTWHHDAYLGYLRHPPHRFKRVLGGQAKARCLRCGERRLLVPGNH